VHVLGFQREGARAVASEFDCTNKIRQLSRAGHPSHQTFDGVSMHAACPGLTIATQCFVAHTPEPYWKSSECRTTQIGWLFKRSRVKPLLHQLHWLPVQQRITYKLALSTYRVRRISTSSELPARQNHGTASNRQHDIIEEYNVDSKAVRGQLNLAHVARNKQESPAVADKPARRESLPKLLQFDVPTTLSLTILHGLGLSSCV